MEIIWFEELDSTQKRLIEDIKSTRVSAPIAYCTNKQTGGIGSRGNSWIGCDGNLFFSFALSTQDLPIDLPIQSIALYFMYLFKEILKQEGSKVWLKWPNDLYLEDKKCAGCVTAKVGDVFVCGIGLNTFVAPKNFAKLDIEVDDRKLLQEYFELLKTKPSWKGIFSKYKIEFHKSRAFTIHIKEREVELKEASLAEDGALIIGRERIYTQR